MHEASTGVPAHGLDDHMRAAFHDAAVHEQVRGLDAPARGGVAEAPSQR
jgi:hypothetical protein